MKIAIISDIHLGDENCKLLESGTVTHAYEALRDAIKDFGGGNPLDYLILNGDILDFSVNTFEESCKTARPVFKSIKNDNLTKEIIYIPGNHDKHVWDAVEWETNIIRKMKDHEDPRKFRRTQPGLLDYDSGHLHLPGVSIVKGTGLYGTLFLEGLFEKDNVLPINIVYPNLYIKTGSDVYLVTHGHMLELAWVLLSELFSGEPELAGKTGLAELEEYNIPLTSMVCTGVGQGGAVSKIFYQIQKEAKSGKTSRLKKVLDNILPKLDKLIELPWYAEIMDNVLLKGIRKGAIYIAEDVKESRYDEEFFQRKSVRHRFLRFYAASCVQAEDLGLIPPRKIIFGHTHEPISAAEPMEIEDLSQLKGEKAFLYNTGGWLRDEGKTAEVFFIDDNGVVSSVNIS
ncbi:MAG: metallophosphoesterase [Thermodesulfovibrionales bacterium]|nr:metallophosphoesterase [Thermodesulfovibrionales bacterium]